MVSLENSRRRIVLLILTSVACLAFFLGVSELHTKSTAKLGLRARLLLEAHSNDEGGISEEGEEGDEHHLSELEEAQKACQEAAEHEGSDESEEDDEKMVRRRILKEKPRMVRRKDLRFTVACLMAMFLFANLFLLYLLNWRDENIRSSIYKMISSTMSIFLAVTINAAAFSFLLDQVIAGKGGRGLGLDKDMKIGYGSFKLPLEFLVGLFVFVSAFFVVNAIGYFFKEPSIQNKRLLYPLRVIGGHITAFAGITAFGTLQIELTKVELFKRHHYLPVVIIMIVMVAIREIARQVRTRVLTGRRVSVNNGIVAEDDEWRVEVCEAEDDATSLIMSFLITQVSIWCISGTMNPLHGHKLEELHSYPVIFALLRVFGYFCGGLAVAVILRKKISTDCFGAALQSWMTDPTKGYVRTMNNLQLVCAMCMSWCLMTAGFWLTQRLLDKTQADNMEMAKIANAVTITFIAVVCVVAVDFIADRIRGVDAKAMVGADGVSRLGDVIDGVVDVEDITDNVERVFRTVIDAFGLLVGLCWEKATDAAMETVVLGTCEFAEHPVLTKVLIAVVMLVCVFTAWIKYIVPKAQKTHEEHKIDLRLERVLRANPKVAHKLLCYISDELVIDTNQVESGGGYGQVDAVGVE
jgi:hypothetical protein